MTRVQIRVRLRTGDKAVIVGVVAIAAYERLVRDDEDLISRRVACYRRKLPVLVDLIILATAAHLSEKVPPQWDPYTWLMKWMRPKLPAVKSDRTIIGERKQR